MSTANNCHPPVTHYVDAVHRESCKHFSVDPVFGQYIDTKPREFSDGLIIFLLVQRYDPETMGLVPFEEFMTLYREDPVFSDKLNRLIPIWLSSWNLTGTCTHADLSKLILDSHDSFFDSEPLADD
jgi:hypothetical protein